MKTRKETKRAAARKKAVHLPRTFNVYRKYRNHMRFVHPDLL